MKQLVSKQVEVRNSILMVLSLFVVALFSPIELLASSEARTIAQQKNDLEASLKDVRELAIATPIEREIAGGEVHAYRVSLGVGQFLRVVVEQKGIDVVVRLFGPDGQKISEIDSPNGGQGPEPISLIAPAPGDYRLELLAQKDAASGKYEIKIEELRASTDKDRALMGAEGALAAAQQLRDQGTAESLRKAIEKYNEGLSLARSAENPRGEARALFALGVLSWQLGDSRKSLDHYTQALSIWRALSDRREEARTLHSMGVSYSQLGENQKAIEYYSQALPMRRGAEDRQGEAITLNATGLAHANLGKLQEALDYYNLALGLQRTLGNPRDEATTLSNIGSAYFAMGDLQKAVEYYSQALPLRRTAGDRRGEAATLNNIGVLYWQLGENEKALEYHEQALPLRRSTGDRNGEFVTLQNFGIARLSLGDPHKALEYHNQALALARALEDRFGQAAILSNLGTAYRWLNDLPRALEYYNQALVLRRAIADRRGEANTLSRIGLIHSLLGETEKASAHLEPALALQRAIGDRSGEAITLHGIARVERDRGNLSEARARIESSLDLIEATRSKLASQDLRTSFFASRQSFYEFYVDLLMRMHRAQPELGFNSLALQASERSRARSLLELLNEANADIREGVEPELLKRGRSTQQLLNVKTERLTRLLGGKHTEEQAVAARKEIDTLLAEYKQIETLIRTKSPRYAALTQPQPLSLKEIQQQVLDKDTLLLNYSLGEERSYLWAATPTSLSSFELPGRVEIEKVARRVYQLFTARNEIVKFEEVAERRARIAKADAEYPQAAQALSQMLLGPVASQMKSRRLLIVSDGALQYLPFAALPLPTGSVGKAYLPLITKYEVINLPSASTLAVLRKELAGRPTAPKTVAVLADPVFDSSDERAQTIKAKLVRDVSYGQASKLETQPKRFAKNNELTRSIRDLTSNDGWSFPLPRLPFTRQEADAVVAFAPPRQSSKAIDFAASRGTALNPELGQYRYLHFATHGILNTTHPELSGIILSLIDEKGNEQNGFLLAHEVYNLNLAADLVVLSGCKTGLGKEIKGEGLVNLTRGFMYAGAERVLVSLWDVNDKSTAELMTHFYKGMLTKQRLHPSAALRQAQLAMWQSDRWQAPYYWAAFVLHGEHR